MDDRKFEQQIRDTLLKQTNESVELKDQVWANIQKNMQSESGVIKMSKPRKNPFWKIASAAAVVALILMVGTQPGQAAVKKLKTWLVPEKTVTQKLEGQKETAKVSLKESKVGYTIYFDQQKFKMEKGKNADRIIPQVNGTAIPETYMEIQQIKDKSPQNLASQLAKALPAQFAQVRNLGAVQKPLKSLLFIASDSNKASDYVEFYYVIDNQNGGSFLVKQRMTNEATEGWGTRFNNMLKEFRITKE